MKYYTHKGDLYTSNAPIENEDFTEITEDEYKTRLAELQVNQEPIDTEDEWFVDTAAESDYIEALESLGVQFDG